MYHPVSRIVVLGSTGSIGRQTLEVVRSLPDRLKVVGLAAGRNRRLLAKQAAEFRPEWVYYDRTRRSKTPEIDARFLPMEEMARGLTVDRVVIATSGKAGLSATLAAVEAGNTIAIANKEPLVMAGEIITSEAEIHDASVIPVDSEHSAIWQCLSGEPQKPKHIILTASGGPFRGLTPAQLKRVTPAQALKHPSWKMGKKVTVDSATLMNKGLEVIEAHWLFGLPVESIRVIIHPQSIIHSMVEFYDGSAKAQMAYPDMRLPIQYALTYPDRLANPIIPWIDWSKVNRFDFEPPDFKSFPCLKLAIDAVMAGGTAPTVLCAADEIAVDLFLKERIGFMDIPRLVSKTLEAHVPLPSPGIEDILGADAWARDFASGMARKWG